MENQLSRTEILDHMDGIMSDLEKAMEMLRQLAEGYFYPQNIDANEIQEIKDEPVACLIFSYNVHKIVFDIAYDYIFGSLESLQDLSREIK